MEQDNNATQPEAAAPQRPRRWANLIASVALIMCIAAWSAMAYNESLCTGLGIGALCLAIAGCAMTRRGMWRDIAITGIIASAVLLLVLAIFFFGLDMLVGSIKA